MVRSDAKFRRPNRIGTKEEHHLALPQKPSRVTVSLTERDHALLTEIAEDQDVTLSWVIRQAIAEYLERSRREEPALPFGPVRQARGKHNG